MYYDEKSEVDAPLAHVLVGGDHAGIIQLADAADEIAAADQDLALAPRIAREGLLHQVHHAAGAELARRLEKDVLAGLAPDAAGEVDVLLLVVVPQLACHAKEE